MNRDWVDPQAEVFSREVEKRFENLRLDQFLTLTFDEHSRTQLSQSIKNGVILVNGSVVKPGHRLKSGDCVSGQLAVDQPAPLPVPQDVDFTVLIEDPDFLVIAKPPGLVVHPGSGNLDRTLVNGLLFRYRDLDGVGDSSRPGIVHRLDKDTSGVMVVARTRSAHAALVDQFKNRQVEKIYLALVRGVMPEPSGRIVAPIGRHPVNRQKMAIRETSGRFAASSWKRRKVYDRHTLVEVRIETGRTHQIRVHMAHLGFPVAGDPLYSRGREEMNFSRQMLHSWRLTFSHPKTEQPVAAIAELDKDFTSCLEQLEASRC
jgi:23S rRNA pseudouridine1911/1915/1917 synthase